jgi:ZIP family zinc transporter
MPTSLLNVLSFALLPVGAAMAGGVFAAFRPPRAMFRSYIQHLAAGVVFSVVAIELLPDIIRPHGVYLEVAVGFAAGVALMLALRTYSHKLESRSGEEEMPLGLLAGVGIDILLDGFLIGITFSAGVKEGLLLTLALTLEMISLGLAVATALGKVGKDRKQVILITCLLFLIILVGAFLGAVVIPYLSEGALEVVLSFGLAALLFLVTEELLVEAHQEPESPLATGLFFVGFLIFLLLGMPG